MTGVCKQEIYLEGNDRILSFFLSQELKKYNIEVLERNASKEKDLPLIIFPDQLGKYYEQHQKTFPSNHPLFIIETESKTYDPSVYQSSAIHIHIDRMFKDVLTFYKDMKLTIDPFKIKGIENSLEKMGAIIAHYLNHPPKHGEVIHKRIPFSDDDKQTVGVVGLGYVGLPVAIGMAEKYNVIGYDINREKIAQLKAHIDITREVSTDELKQANIYFTQNPEKLATCDFILIAVPTPITKNKEPDLTALKAASETVGKHLSKEATVIYESTVYPGATEEVCIPILEEHSNLRAGIDFYVGYSPERINPGDREHTFKKNNKIIAGQNEETLKKISALYSQVIDADLHHASSIKVAEAAKIVENAQRDLNIAFMNELAEICQHLDIPTMEVIEAAATKWNFLKFSPGLVGGHCIGVDPYYLIHKANSLGYQPKLIQKARMVNDAFPSLIVQRISDEIIQRKLSLHNLKITVLGVTFKENVSDMRNSKAVEMIDMLQEKGLDVQVCDVQIEKTNGKYMKITDRIALTPLHELEPAHIVVLAVPHQLFAYTRREFFKPLLADNGIIMDLKGVIPRDAYDDDDLHWTL